MEKPEFFVTPGCGERLLELLNYSQPLKLGNRVEISGQGGWDDELQIPESLAEKSRRHSATCSAPWKRLGPAGNTSVHISSYHVGGFPPMVNETMAKLYRHYLPSHAPIWTQTGVAAPTTRIEVRVTAILS